MTATSVLREPTFADLIAAIEQAPELPEQTRRHWICSARRIAECLDRPVGEIPARWTALRASVGDLHHARVGVAAKTLANHKANLRAALRWRAKEHPLPRKCLSPDWAAFRDRVDDRYSRLSSLMRYCAARGIEPASVNDEVVEEFWRHRSETTALASDNSARRRVARAWNACAHAIQGLRRLAEPPVMPKAHPVWEDFPEGFRREVDTYIAGLTKPRRGRSGRRIRPCKPTTLRNRRADLAAVARMAVRLGVPIENLTSLAALLHPDVVERVIDAYWAKNGEEPTIFTIDLGWRLLAIARETGGLDQTAIERLEEIKATLEDYRRSGLTPKNLRLVRQVLTEGVWAEVVSLPGVLMRQARSAKLHAPVKSAVTAQLAIGIAILTFAPIRISNLIGIELGKNLIKPGGLNSPYWLVFPHYDVKNRVDLNFQFDQLLTNLIDEYLDEFRPALLRSANKSWLFPGENGEPKRTHTFGPQLSQRIEKAAGLRITVHQFRHAAAAIYLKHRPGDYETVRRLLGHRSIQTTIRFYCGLQTTQATEQFGKIIREQIQSG